VEEFIFISLCRPFQILLGEVPLFPLFSIEILSREPLNNTLQLSFVTSGEVTSYQNQLDDLMRFRCYFSLDGVQNQLIPTDKASGLEFKLEVWKSTAIVQDDTSLGWQVFGHYPEVDMFRGKSGTEWVWRVVLPTGRQVWVKQGHRLDVFGVGDTLVVALAFQSEVHGSSAFSISDLDR